LTAVTHPEYVDQPRRQPPTNRCVMGRAGTHKGYPLVMAESRWKANWQQRAFRWSLTALTTLVVVRVVWDWFDERQRLRQAYGRDPVPFGNYIIVHTNSSLRTHLCLALVVGFGLLQIVAVWVWQDRLAHRLAHRWWVPPIFELVLCVAFGVAAVQTAGHYAVNCAGGAYSGFCSVSTPYVLHNGWLAVWAAIGLVIGLAWTLTTRPSSSGNTSHPGTSAEVASTIA